MDQYHLIFNVLLITAMILAIIDIIDNHIKKRQNKKMHNSIVNDFDKRVGQDLKKELRHLFDRRKHDINVKRDRRERCVCNYCKKQDEEKKITPN